jgi:hypothetical protein
LSRSPRGTLADKLEFVVAPHEKGILHPFLYQDVQAPAMRDHFLQPAACKILQINSQPTGFNAALKRNFGNGLLPGADFEESGCPQPQ